MDRIAAGEELEEGQQEKEKTETGETVTKQVDLGVEPPQPQFVLNIPNLSPVDL